MRLKDTFYSTCILHFPVDLIRGSKSTKLYDLIQDGLTYLDTCADFWRQQKPMYARKRAKATQNKAIPETTWSSRQRLY